MQDYILLLEWKMGIIQRMKKIARAINSYIDENYYGLSRGIFPKYKKDGDGVYNQDLSKNAMLIEVGGVDNTLDELYNTIDVLTVSV